MVDDDREISLNNSPMAEEMSSDNTSSGKASSGVTPSDNTAMPPAASWKSAVRVWMRMIRFEYSLFALPYAYLGAFLAAAAGSSEGAFVFPPLWSLLWLTVAMVGIRSFAMTLNRLADMDVDALNPRTAGRALITGAISVNAARVFAFVSVLAYFAGCYFMNRLALILSPVPILVIISYSWAKRFTWKTHFLLGLCHAFAPVAGWISVSPEITLPAVLFSCAMLFWTAGFDMIYSTQDADFDIACRLHSAPAQFGVPVALTLAGLCHTVFALFLFMAFWGSGLGIAGFVTWLVVAGLLVWEHKLVKPGDLKKLDAAFFILNAIIAALIFLGVLAGIYF